MKTLKIFVTVLTLALSTSAFAGDDHSERLEMGYALKSYIDAVTKGRIEELPALLDANSKFTTTRGAQIITHNRQQLLKMMKSQENVIQNCEATYTLIETTPTASVVKVTLKYENFSRVEYINLSNTNKGWKITSISTSFI